MNRLLHFSIALTLSCLFVFQATAQVPQTQPLPGNCSCASVLDSTVRKVSRIYAGFDDKVNGQTRQRYTQLLSQLRSQAKTTTSQAACFEILKTYTRFFNDSHVFAFWLPDKAQRVSASVANKGRIDLLEFRPLNANYLYIKLAVFNQTEVDRLDSLLRANTSLLARTSHVIIDLRGNGGGNASTSDEMIKLIYTNPVIYPSWDYRSSPEIIKAKEKVHVDYEKDTITNAFFYQRSKQLLRGLRTNPSKLVRDGDDLVRTASVDTSQYPKHIAFLIDKGCASSTEFFVFEGKQSKKVTLFGQNTMGVMDYGEDQDFGLCDGLFSLAIPWGRNGWVRQYRIDTVGFAPDVRIPPNETDWIQFVQRYYQNNKH